MALSFSQVNQDNELSYEKIEILNVEEGSLSFEGGESSTNISSDTSQSNRNTNSGIGETMGELSVSLTGAAVYNIPIAVPPGINGIEPEISLAYNSQSGNGIAGYGWNLNGISSITRIPSTKFHDNLIHGVDFDEFDRFALDGERLLLKSGIYGTDGAEYETEAYSNLKIVSYGTSPYGLEYGPAYFIIHYPDGSFAHYGNSDDSSSRLNYSITYWQNPQGINISYEYLSVPNTTYIESIKYGSLNSNTPINEVKFNYSSLSGREISQAYIGGLSFKKRKRLISIESFSNNIRYRGYNLNHTINIEDNRYKKLQSIQEESGDGSLSHSLIGFNYTSTETGVNYVEIDTDLTLSNIEQRNSETISLDFTGNGKMDFIVYPKPEKDKFWIFTDIQNGGTNSPYLFDTGVFEALFPVTALSHQNKILAGQNLAMIKNGASNTLDIQVYSQGSSAPVLHQYTKTINAPTFNQFSCQNGYPNVELNRIPQEYVSGDFNGDGLTDVLAISKKYTQTVCYINEFSECECTVNNEEGGQVQFIDLNRNLTSNFSTYSGILEEPFDLQDRLYSGDFNGDGKSDIIHLKNDSYFVYTFDENNQIQPIWLDTDDGAINLEKPIYLGDYNGDGKTDFMHPSSTISDRFAFYISTGKSFKKGFSTQPFDYLQTNWNGLEGVLRGYNLIPLDFNGDGKTDIIDYRTITYNSNENGSQTITIFKNIGLNNTDPDPWKIKFLDGGSATKNGNLKHFPIPIFLTSNQANKNLDFASISNQWVTNFTFTQDHREDVLLRSINNNGVSYEIDYSSLDPTIYNDYNMQVYQTGNDAIYPNVNLKTALGTKVVTMISREVLGETTLRQLYAYQDGIYNLKGRGFQGFKGIARSNWHSQHADRIFHVSKYNTQLRGAVIDEYIQPYSFYFDFIPSDYITRTSFNNQSSIASNKVFKLWITSSLTQNSLEGTYTNISYMYDSYNNPKKISTNYNGQGNSVVDITYDNNTGNNYYIGRIIDQINTSSIGSETFSTETQFVYQNNLIIEKKSKGNNTPFDSEHYYYDTFGNVIKKQTKPYNSDVREVEFEFDSSGRFLIKSIDVEDLESHYQYNTETGTLRKEIDPFGKITSFNYDSWNRTIKITDYLGKRVQTNYVENPDFTYTVTIIADDGSETIESYDIFKRLVKVQEKNVLGQWISLSYEYDEYDRIYRQSEPYSGTSPNQWNTYEYDYYGRPIKQTLYTGRVIDIAHNNLTLTVDDGVKTVSSTKNAIGNITSVTDPGGTINYGYFGNGNLKTTTYNSNIIHIEQDGWGRRIKLIDPSAGTYKYQYNGYGELTKETTPKGSTTYSYSPIGKLTQEHISGDGINMITDYIYDAYTKLMTDMVVTNTNGNNSTHSYAYDNYQRLVKAYEANEHASFFKILGYDSFGRVGSEKSEAKLSLNGKATSVTTKNTYQNGTLKTITDANTSEVLWNLESINARGQVTSISMGTDLGKQNTYNNYGYLTETKVEKNASSSPVEIMKLTNNFNTQRGTLTSRTNSLFSWSETFTYDNLDRLLDFNDNSGNHSHTYDLFGRIVSNSKIGTYSYPGNSYQVKEVDLNDQADLHYQENPLQKISYNAFKKPTDINQEHKESISFQYNTYRGRSHMFYGDTNSNIYERNNRKHYSADGTMEISYDRNLDKTVFVNYIGGNAYSSDAVWRSEQDSSGNTNEEYIYLHRDYLGSILMLSDKDGEIKEKRHFDAWGNIVKLTDGNDVALDKFVYLDRGYTGHEHLQGVDLIHMNGRLYDSKLRRFLAPDNHIQNPYNTQNFNRYGYVLNNPLMYIDPSGETGEFPSSGGGGEGLTNGQQTILGNLLASAYNFLKDLQIGRWLGTNIRSAARDVGNFFRGIGRGIRKLFAKKPPKGPITTYYNNNILINDPLAGASSPVEPSNFGGILTSNNNLGIIGMVGDYYSELGNSFTNRLRQTGQGLSDFISNPVDTIGRVWDNHWETIRNPHLFAQSVFNAQGRMDPIKQLTQDFSLALLSDNFAATLGHLNGIRLADKTVEGVGFVAGGAGGRIFSGISSRLGTLGPKIFQSRAFGGKSSLFGRKYLGSFGGKSNGILNRGYLRLGWSWDKLTQTHYFQPRFGPKFGAKHFWPWFKYKP